MKYNYEYEKVVSNMELKATELSSKIILKHMNNNNQSYYKSIMQLKKNINNNIELYDKNNHNILHTINERIDFKKKVYIYNNNIYLVFDGTYGHLDIKYIVLKNDTFLMNNNILENIIYIFIAIFIFMALIGYFLAKLFLKPILIKRKKLDLFIKDTTHELNTPITALLMSINKKNPITPNNIKRINLSARRISEIYNDLTYLFLEDKNDKDIQNLNLKPILEDSLEYFKELSAKKKINMTIDLDDVAFKTHKESFIRLTNNIISNAIKYTNSNGNINIELKDNKFIVIDDGIGIDDDKQKNIFDRFYRATSTNGGFGIGLDIVSSICNTYNIKIKLESKMHKGSKFILEF